MNAPDNEPAKSATALGAMIHLATVHTQFAEVEALEDEVQHRMAYLGALLPRGQFRLVWELLDAEQRRGQAEGVRTPARLGRDGGGMVPDC